MAQNRFASVPNISIPRSRFKQPFNHSTTFLHGELVPIDCFEIVPGDTYKLNLASLIWMSNPIRPIFGNITAHVDVFFVPMRLVWQYTKEFFGENKTSSGYQTTDYKIPSVYLGADVQEATGSDKKVFGDSLSHYLGKPIVDGNITPGYTLPVSILKERAYYEIWNTYYRSQQLQNPVLINYGGNGPYDTDDDLGYIGTLNGSYIPLYQGLMKVNKEFDYFTAATLYPQYGPAVSLPLGTYAPIKTEAKTHNMATYSNKGLILGLTDSNVEYETGTQNLLINYTNRSSDLGGRVYPDLSDVDLPAAGGKAFTKSNLFADLSTATSATINQLRYAFAVQKYLERSNFGSRYFELLQVHYGVTSPDATLQIPQRIGHADFPINISTVLSTAGAAADSTTELGMPGATSCTGHKDYLFTHAFTEHGYLFVLLSTTHERSYTQGVLREDLRQDNFEFYVPEFANLGDQEILNAEIFYGDNNHNKDVFGYQEHWAEYRFRPHRVSGLLDPQAYQSLDFWVLTDDYSSRPSLDGTWLVEDRTNLARCLVSGVSGPDYIGDFYFDYTATREMPLFTIPGLIDHFGSY